MALVPPDEQNMQDSDDELPKAMDAIPKNSISLTAAYGCVVNFLIDYPEFQLEFDDEWSEALKKSREVERNLGHDPEQFNDELETAWHRRKEANLILRLAIEEQELVACVRDPETGEILQLSSKNWILSEWEDYIPPDIWDDYIVPDVYEAPGPAGTFIRGALRPVFFMRSEFDVWFEASFDEEAVASISDQNPRFESLLVRFRQPRQFAVKKAVFELWGARGPPPDLSAKLRNREINGWLARHRPPNVGEATIRRALRELYGERT
jgi:hypothetical protein